MDDRQWDALARAVAGTTPRRRFLRILGMLPVLGALGSWWQAAPVAADGSGAIVGGGHRHRRRHHRRRRHHHHHPRPHRRKRRCAPTCAGCCDAAGRCRHDDPTACGRNAERCTVCGPGEICSSGLCHNPYGCTAAMDFCQTDPMNPTITPCPQNPNGACILVAEGVFCIRVGDPLVDPAASRCAPGNDCANCPVGSDCVTLLGGACTCPDGGTKGCAVPPAG